MQRKSKLEVDLSKLSSCLMGIILLHAFHSAYNGFPCLFFSLPKLCRDSQCFIVLAARGERIDQKAGCFMVQDYGF